MISRLVLAPPDGVRNCHHPCGQVTGPSQLAPFEVNSFPHGNVDARSLADNVTRRVGVGVHYLAVRPALKTFPDVPTRRALLAGAGRVQPDALDAESLCDHHYLAQYRVVPDKAHPLV